MIEVLLTSSVLILALALLRRGLRGRIDPRLQYGLWLLVALRLLIPGSLFPAPVTVSGALSAWEEARSAAGQALPSATEAPAADAGALPILGTLYDAYTEEQDIPLNAEPYTWVQETIGEGYTVNGVEPDLEHGTQTVTYSQYDSIWSMPFWRWPLYAGTALAGAALLLSNLRFYLSLRKRRRPVPPSELPIACGARVYQVEGLASPCLVGLLRPAIYLNEAALAPGRLEHILVHEEAHRRHGDHLWGLVRGVCLALFWYDPLVWWAAALSRRDCELACDYSAIRRLGEDRRLDYGQTLVSMIVPGRPLAGLLRTATTMSEGKRTMRERIALIAHRPRMLKITLAAVTVAVAAIVVLTFGGTGEKTRAEPSTAEDQASADNIQPATDSAEPDAPDLPQQALGAGFVLSSTRYTHPSGMFSLVLPEDWVGAVAYTETADGVDFFEANTYAEASYGWLAGIHPQPSSWVEGNLLENMISLGSFDTNGVPHQYVLEYRLSRDFSTEPAAQPYENQFWALLSQVNYIGFRSSVTPELIDQLVHDSYESDMAAAIAYLPYLSWSSYRNTYGDSGSGGGELFSLLEALWSYAGSGQADWGQYHNILSAPVDSAIDGAYATAYQDVLWALYDSNPEYFAGVLGSDYITDAERDNAVYWLRAPMAWAEGREEPLSDSAVRQRLGLLPAAEEETAPNATITDMEMMNSIMRGFYPNVMMAGSPEGLEIDLTGNWTLEGIQSAIFDALADHITGTALEGDLSQVRISYSFQFPEALQDGTILTVPYTASYQGDVSTLPSGATHAPVASTGELTATVRLVGQGVTAPVDEAFAAGQVVYQQLAACAQLPELEVAAGGGENFDVAVYLQDAIASNLASAGLSGSYQVASLTTGGYTVPNAMAPSAVQTIDFSVSFSPLAEDGLSGITISSQLTVRTVEG